MKTSHQARFGVPVPIAPAEVTPRRRRTAKVSARPYIRRRLLVVDEDERSVEWPEEEFFADRGPLVVLGDPGLGKSRLVERFCERSGSACVTAISLPARPQRPLREETFPRKTVVDEVDAVPAGDPRETVDAVLAHLGHFSDANFVLVCRSADWVDAGLDAIEAKWGKTPVIGTLLPLDEGEIARLVDGSGTGWEGAELLDAARERGLESLLGNPQLLGMLLRTAGNGWPESRRDLYENACRELAMGKNPAHRRLAGQGRPGVDSLCDTAGFVFSQLLLSGTEGVATPGSGGLPGIGDLSSDSHPTPRVAGAIATDLFRVGGDGALVPRHRTVAEYLAAGWLARSLGKQGSRLGDLEALLRTSSDAVPSSARGVHAWIATLGGDIRERFIRRDPYGFWCYGDRDSLTDGEAAVLLDALVAHAARHPGFHNGGGRANFGRWPKSPPLLGRAIARIRDRDTPPDMARLLVEAIHGAPRSQGAKKALMGVVLDARAPNRALCLDGLARHMTNAELGKAVAKLVRMADTESVCVAIDTIRRHHDRIGGKIIARALAAAESRTTDLGLGQDGIPGRLSLGKAGSCLRETAKIAGDRDDPTARGARRTIVPLLERLFEADAPPAAPVFWGCLARVGRPRDFENDPEGEIAKYLATHDEYRRAAQAAAILGTDPGDLKARLRRLAAHWPGVSVDEEDWLFHLEDLAGRQPRDWRRRWRKLFKHGSRRGFAGTPMAKALDLSRRHGLLPASADTPTQLPGDTAGDSSRAGARGTGKAEGDEPERRHAPFARRREEIAAGEAADLLGQAAAAYFGVDLIEGATPEDRVTHLVGRGQADSVFAGIHRVVTEGMRAPTARSLAESRARGRPADHEHTLLLGCHRLARSPDGLTALHPNVVPAALAACHLGAWSRQLETHARVRAQLEKTVFGDPRAAKRYFRDIVEPHLEAGADRAPGIDVLRRRPGLSGIAGQLAHEWLRDFPGLPAGTFGGILDLGIASGARAKVSALVASRLRGGRWPSPKDRDNFMCAAFAVDFHRHRKAVEAYAHEDRDRFWGLSGSLRRMGNPMPGQIRLVVEAFAPRWSRTDHSGGLPAGGQNAGEAGRIMVELIKTLGDDMSAEATKVLACLARSDRLGEYSSHIRKARSTQKRRSLDRVRPPLSLKQVRTLVVGLPRDGQHRGGVDEVPAQHTPGWGRQRPHGIADGSRQ